VSTSDQQPRACDRRAFFRTLTARGLERVQQAGQQFLDQQRHLTEALGTPADALPDSPHDAGVTPPQPTGDDADHAPDAEGDDATPPDPGPLKLGTTRRPSPDGSVARGKPGSGQDDSR